MDRPRNVTLALSGGLLLVYLCFVSRRLWRCDWAAVRLAVVKHSRQLCCIDRPEEMQMKQFTRQRISWSQGISECVLHCMGVKHVLGGILLLTNLSDSSVLFLIKDLPGDIAGFALLFLITVTPKRFVPRILDFSQLAFTGFIIFLLFRPQSCERQSLIQMARLLGSLIASNARLACPCQVIFFLAKCVSCRGRESWLSEVCADAWLTALFLVILIVYEMLILRLVMDTVPVEVLATKRSLLSALCDAVVRLGPDLEIVEKAPKLANLLCQKSVEADKKKSQGSNSYSTSLQGTSFLDFISQPDQERFVHFIDSALDCHPASAALEPAPAEALNVQMQGSSGMSIQVQLFHCCFLEPDGKVGHLIGIIREAGELPTGLDMPFGVVGNAFLEAPASRSQRHSNASSLVGTYETDEPESASGLTDSISVVAAKNARNAMRAKEEDENSEEDEAKEEDENSEEDEVGPLRIKAPDVNLVFNKLTFVVKDSNQNEPPVVSASLLDHESLLRWAVGWTSTKDWVQDFVNAALRPLNTRNWPSGAGAPTALHFHVALSGSCQLPPDILSRPSDPRPQPSGAGATCRGTSSMAPSVVARRLELGRVKLVARRSSRKGLNGGSGASPIGGGRGGSPIGGRGGTEDPSLQSEDSQRRMDALTKRMKLARKEATSQKSRMMQHSSSRSDGFRSSESGSLSSSMESSQEVPGRPFQKPGNSLSI